MAGALKFQQTRPQTEEELGALVEEVAVAAGMPREEMVVDCHYHSSGEIGFVRCTLRGATDPGVPRSVSVILPGGTISAPLPLTFPVLQDQVSQVSAVSKDQHPAFVDLHFAHAGWTPEAGASLSVRYIYDPELQAALLTDSNIAAAPGTIKPVDLNAVPVQRLQSAAVKVVNALGEKLQVEPTAGLAPENP